LIFRLLFIYLFIAYNLIYSSENLKKCWKKQDSNAWRSSRSHCPLDHTCCLQLLQTVQHAHENFKQWFRSVATLDYLTLAFSIFVSS